MKEWRELLSDYAQGYQKLTRVVDQIPDPALDYSPDGKEWSIRQIIHHLADGACLWSLFIKQALGDQGGEFKLGWYWALPQEEWADIWCYSSRDIRSSLELFKANQENTLSLLEAIEEPREAFLHIHWNPDESEKAVIRDAVRVQIIHLKDHLKDIRKLLDQFQESSAK